jgi:hypothetical protein
MAEHTHLSKMFHPIHNEIAGFFIFAIQNFPGPVVQWIERLPGRQAGKFPKL